MKNNYSFLKMITGLAAMLVMAMISQNLQAQYIITQPRDATVFEGFTGTLVFEVEIIPVAKVDLQWYFKAPGATEGKALTGENAARLEVLFASPITTKWHGAGYYCVAKGLEEDISLDAYIWVQSPVKDSVITGQPVDVTLEVGYAGLINFNVEVEAGLEAKYAWYERKPSRPGGVVPDWVQVGVGQQLTLKTDGLDPRQNGTAYRCLVIHGEEEYSQVAYLWVQEPKKLIKTEPVDVTEKEGAEIKAVYFDITPVYLESKFQWQVKYPGKEWADYPDAVKPVFEFPVKSPLGLRYDGTAVRCIVIVKETIEVSDVAYLHVEEANKYILVDPEDVMMKENESRELHFYIKYDESYPHLVFQWQEMKPGGSWVDITHVIAYKPELYYPIKMVTLDWNGWGFRCVVINKDNGDIEYSKEAILYVMPDRPYFLGHPSNATVCESAETAVKFAVKVEESIKLSLQWQMSPANKEWYDIKGADSTVYVKEFTSVPLSYNGYTYRCRATDEFGFVQFSDIAFLNVRALPQITSHPASQEKMVGEAATFNVAATGYKPFTYQWYKDEDPLSGAVFASLSLFPLAETDSGDYTVVVRNACKNSGDTSNAATLTVNAPEFGDGWFEQEIATSKNLTDIKFTGANSGWVTVTNSNRIYKTVDGGKTWTDTSVITTMNWEAVFTRENGNYVWIAGEDSIKYSQDGGGTWMGGAVASEFSTHNLYDLYFTDNSNGWAVGDNGLVLNSNDGGASWTWKHSGNHTFVPGADVTLSAVHFVNADTGFAVGNNGVIIVTEDGGSSWAPVESGTSSALKDIHFLNDQIGWISGEDGVLLNTQDGGDSWSAVPVEASVADQDLNGVFFVDADNGWVITGNGKILRTNNGGDAWYFQESGTTQSLNAIDFADYDNGWVVGNASTILRTASSGCLVPTVSLFEDKEFCASVNYQLVADSFVNNVDCNYLWSHEDDDGIPGKFTVTESGKYWVRVTSVCGKVVSDTVNVVLYPLPEPDAGSDQGICDGDSVQLLATGGVEYSWNNASYLDDPEVQNPKAGPPVGKTDFIVTVTDENLCENSDTVSVTVYPIPTSAFTASDEICLGDSAAITYAGTATANANFWWSFDERSTVLSGDSIGPYGVSWDTAGVYLVTLLVEENGCSSDTSEAEVTVHPIPTSAFSLQSAVCGSDLVEVEYTGGASGDADFIWSFDGGVVSTGDDTGPGPISLSWASPGTKTVGLSVTDNACTSDPTTKQIVVAYPYSGQAICLVTVDIETGKNAIIWEKGDHPGVEFYKVYREASTGGGVYDELVTLPADTLSYYVDETSEPASKIHKYRVSVIDTCGNESAASLYHKSMLLTTSLGIGVINVSWSEYEIEGTGFGFEYYIIMRGPSATEVKPYDTIPADNEFYPDGHPRWGQNFYRVAGVMDGECSPSGNFKAGTGPYSHSLSNLDDNRLQSTGIRDEIAANNGLRVYPNPFREKLNLEYQLQDPASVKIEVYNILGVRVLELYNGDQIPGVYNYNIMASDLDGSSIYYLKFSVDGATVVKKLVPSK